MSVAAEPTGYQVGDVIAWYDPERRRELESPIRAKNGEAQLVTLHGTIPADTPGLRLVGHSDALQTTAPADLSPLTEKESSQLERCETVIEAGLQTFYQVGNALMTIREGRLYRASHRTFEDYCRQRWEMSKSHANRMIGAAEITDRLAPMGVKPEDLSERQVRPLGQLPEEQQPEAFRRAQELAQQQGEALTGRHVEQAVAELRPAPQYDYRDWAVDDYCSWSEARGGETLRRGGQVKDLKDGGLFIMPIDGGGPPTGVVFDPDREGLERLAEPYRGICSLCTHPFPPDTEIIRVAENGETKLVCEECYENRMPDPPPAPVIEPDAAVAPSVPAVAAAPVAPEPSAQKSSAAPAPANKPLKTMEEIAKERAESRGSEPPKPAPVNFPLMPDMVERIRVAGIGTLPALRFGCTLAELAKAHGTEPQFALKDLETLYERCKALGTPVHQVLASLAPDGAVATGEGEGDQVDG